MHRFHSKSTIVRFRFASLTVFLNCLLIPGTIGLLVYAITSNDRDLIIVSLGLVFVACLSGVLQWLLGARTRCPLCMTPVLVGKGCAKHRNARTLLGSYRLRVAAAVIFQRSFVCPYCNESAAMQVRSRHSGPRPKGY